MNLVKKTVWDCALERIHIPVQNNIWFRVRNNIWVSVYINVRDPIFARVWDHVSMVNK